MNEWVNLNISSINRLKEAITAPIGQRLKKARAGLRKICAYSKPQACFAKAMIGEMVLVTVLRQLDCLNNGGRVAFSALGHVISLRRPILV